MVTPLLRPIAVFFTFILYITACVPSGKIPTGPVKGINDTAAKWFDWVGAFKPHIDSSTRTTYLNNVRSQLLAVRSDYIPPASDSVDKPYTYFLYHHIRDSIAGPFQLLNVNVQFCNCPDDRLWNVIADLGMGHTDTTGESTPTSPKPPSGTVVKGEAVDALSDNEDMSNPGSNGGALDMSGLVTFKQFEKSRAVIAVIDTGLDTLLLSEPVRRAVLWHGPSGGQNLLIGANVTNYTDDHIVRHGTAVSTIAMKAFNNESSQRQLPQLMTLKAADATGRGTLFEYTCALAFAINNNANVINSSMGFYGQPTELIETYLRLAKSKNIAVVAAAGNGDSTHDLPLCRSDINPANKLESPRLFYPAVFAQDQKHYMILSVTGKSEPGKPCYHQNYSSDYVTLGVVNMPLNSSCCFFLLPFIGQGRGLEGSSFATPVVSGRLAYKVLQGTPPSSVRNCLDALGDVNTSGGGGPVTQANQYIEYTP